MDRVGNVFANLKLNQKFTLAIMLIVVMPMVGFSIFLYQNISKNTLQQSASELGNQVKEDYGTMQSIVEFSNMSAQSFLGNQALKDMLLRLKDHEEIRTEDYIAFNRDDIALLERLVNSNPYLYQVRVYADSNTFPEMIPILYHGDRVYDFPWGEDYEPGKWQIDYADDSVTHLMALINDAEDDYGNKIGTIETAVSMDEFFPDMYRGGERVWSCFVSADGQVAADDRAASESPWKEAAARMAARTEQPPKEMEMKNITLEGEPVIWVSQPVKELSGTYIRVASIKDQMNRLAAYKNQLLLILLVIFLCLALVENSVVKVLLRKFYNMLLVVRKVQEGDLAQRVSNPGSDEMGEMSTQFNKMLDHIQILMKENINREVLIKNTEIKALQNQINAHFIYNVLEAVKMMAEINEEYEISDSVTALGELLRYGMKWTSSDVTIRQEVEYIKNYIQLMNLRYDYTIGLSINIPDHIYEQQIPKMSLQPIVENAICHGIEETEEDSVIYIKAVCHEKDYDIEITDSGKGMDEQQIALLKRKVSGEIEVSGGSGNGIGLKNVQDRIHIRFGESYGLHFASREGCYTKVSVRLPYSAAHIPEDSGTFGGTEKEKGIEEKRDEDAVDCGR